MNDSFTHYSTRDLEIEERLLELRLARVSEPVIVELITTQLARVARELDKRYKTV
jgi:hypothetical protein